MPRSELFVLLLEWTAFASAMHEWTNATAGKGCVYPGTCTPPAHTFSRVVVGPKPGQQWNINGGFCGAFSTQQCALSAGAWISQDLVRKANKDWQGPFVMHGNTQDGYEVMPSNIFATAAGLKLDFEQWDYTQPKPQAAAFKRWIKAHLAQGHPIVWFPICKGDGHDCYATASHPDGACPNGGSTDHVEAMFGLYSNHPLSDSTVYADDVIVHTSDQDLEPYYRPIDSLDDSLAMNGNCKDAGAGFGRNEMYPCFDREVTYAIAVKGLAVQKALPLSLEVPLTYEPNVRSWERPKEVLGKVTVSGLVAGESYVLYRFASTDSLPKGPPPFSGFSHKHEFTPSSDTWVFSDPTPFLSNSATYYVAVSAGSAGPASS